MELRKKGGNPDQGPCRFPGCRNKGGKEKKKRSGSSRMEKKMSFRGGERAGGRCKGDTWPKRQKERSLPENSRPQGGEKAEQGKRPPIWEKAGSETITVDPYKTQNSNKKGKPTVTKGYKDIRNSCSTIKKKGGYKSIRKKRELY